MGFPMCADCVAAYKAEGVYEPLVPLRHGLHLALNAWLDKLEQRAKRGEDVIGESLRFSVRQDAERDEDGTPYLHVTLTERTATDCEGRL